MGACYDLLLFNFVFIHLCILSFCISDSIQNKLIITFPFQMLLVYEQLYATQTFDVKWWWRYLLGWLMSIKQVNWCHELWCWCLVWVAMMWCGSQLSKQTVQWTKSHCRRRESNLTVNTFKGCVRNSSWQFEVSKLDW